MKTIIDIENKIIAVTCKASQFKRAVQELKDYINHCEVLNIDELEIINGRKYGS